MPKASKQDSSEPEKIEAYLAALPEEPRRIVEDIRQCIKEAAPEASEVLSYGMPAFKMGDQRFVYYAGWKKHVALYGLTKGVLEKFRPQVSAYKTPKGVLKFKFDEPLPVQLIKKLVRACLEELASKS